MLLKREINVTIPLGTEAHSPCSALGRTSDFGQKAEDRSMGSTLAKTFIGVYAKKRRQGRAE